MQAAAIMAKAPYAGHVKTRLVPPLSPAEAALLYESFLLDTIEELGRVSGIAPFLAYTPRAAEPYFSGIVPKGYTLIAQSPGDLGDRLARVAEALFRRGATAVVLLGSDTPTLPIELVHRAFRSLSHADVVLGPSTDGGYYLIGMQRPTPGLFADIPWSSGRVAACTRARAGDLGVTVSLLPPWSDIDTADDLERLCRTLAGSPENIGPARHTRSALVRLGLLPSEAADHGR